MDETTTIAPTPVLQIPTTLRSLIEALIFAAQEPLTIKQMQSMYTVEGVNGDARTIETEEITRIIEALNGDYAAAERPYRIVSIAGGYQFATLPAYADWLGKLYKEQARRKLSQASTETLAIIAYRQPITKPEIESIRGVDCDYVLKTLLEKEMVTIVGRATTVGRPLLYGTTKEFLKHFGLNDIGDLPRPREIQEILGESQFESERRMLEAQQGLLEKKEEDFKSRLPHIPKRKPELDDQVKIIPKKRVHDFKVEPSLHDQPVTADEQRVETPGDLGGEPPALKEQQEESAASVRSEEEIAPPSDVPIRPLAFTTNENVEHLLNVEEPQATAEADAPSTEESAVEPISTPVEPQATEVSSLEEESLPTPEVIASADVVHEAPLETPEAIAPAANATVSEQPPAEEPGTALMEERVQGSPSGEVPVTEEQVPAEEQAALSSVRHEEEPGFAESRVTEKEQPVESVEQVEAKIEGTAEVLPPVVEEQPRVVARPESAPQTSRFGAAAAAPHPKSRWQSWKEKIQGFIKKLFA